MLSEKRAPLSPAAVHVQGRINVKNKLGVCLPFIASFMLFLGPVAQNNPQPSKNSQQDSTSPSSEAQKNNLNEYIELLRSNVKKDKAQIMGAVMQLSSGDAAKFWPIYAEYDAELTKINDKRVANIEEYARNYNHMTDQKADELIQNAMSYRRMRAELLAKYYERVKQPLGAFTAARFVQVEDQLLLIIDLQIDSSLPLVGESS